MAGETVHIESYTQMIIHLKDDGSECRVRKPETVCPCGTYHVIWLPVREPVPTQDHRTFIEGRDIA